MAETITGGGRNVGRKHKWNNKIRGQKLVRLDPNKTRTPELNFAGVLQWVEGMIYAKKYGYDRIKVKCDELR